MQFKPWIKIYLNVPYEEKEIAKSNGAIWDNQIKKWFITAGKGDLNLFKQWMVNQNNPYEKYEYRKANLNLISFFQVETNGLPEKTPNSFLTPYNDLDKYKNCRIIKLSCILCDKTIFNIVTSKSFVIYPEQFIIANSQFHGITHEYALEHGIDFSEAVKEVMQILSKSDCIYSHNANFQIETFKSELYRRNLNNELTKLKSIQSICTADSTKQLIGLKNLQNNIKNPTLKELYFFATGKNVINNNDSPDNEKNKSNIELLYDAIKNLATEKKIDLK
jgi:hypothetical protein